MEEPKKPDQQQTIQAFNTDTREQQPKTTKGEETKQAIQLIFSRQFADENTQSQSSFDCDQKIFAVLRLENYPTKLHNITVKWIDPYNKEREVTNIPTYTAQEHVYTWSSLSLHRDVTAGMLQWINPAAGMEEFIGEWQVKILIDETVVKTGKFTVVC